jgi:hypothetical protein
VRSASEQGRNGQRNVPFNFLPVLQILLPLLVEVIQMKYQNTKVSLFDTKGTIMSCFIVAVLAKFYAKHLQERRQTNPNVNYLISFIKLVDQISGFVACGILVWILLPPFWYWTIFCAGALFNFMMIFKHIYKSPHGILAPVFNKLRDAFQRICNRTQQAFDENSVEREGEHGSPSRVQIDNSVEREGEPGSPSRVQIV